MNAFEVSLWAARKTACGSALRFDGILANAFVMRVAVGNAHDMEAAEGGVWHRTAEVVRVDSLIGYDFIETADGKRILILSHECAEAKRSFEHMRRVIELNADYFASKRAA
ncbi:hypothetical protein VQ574_20960 (plasmid) [Stutzerimonas frequens]|uniref:hypothetical protein n=1 Tax=Stutzerimonas stutzeri group TaxID=136846 RepID=UPI00265CC516|nr:MULTISPECIES: hypothetical protein [Stutzerimonas stutzeri group]MCF6783349.1 hypothetical protein [Stutzerimonas stutzeri]WRW29409.1 hypothetical protein VQ574_20960 [Stutzerimonas frequens]